MSGTETSSFSWPLHCDSARGTEASKSAQLFWLRKIIAKSGVRPSHCAAARKSGSPPVAPLPT
jgi:hypothetical protein